MQINSIVDSIKSYLASSSHALSDYKNDTHYRILDRLHYVLQYISYISSILLVVSPVLYGFYSIFVLSVVKVFIREGDPVTIESTARALSDSVASNIRSYFMVFIVAIVSAILYALCNSWLKRTRYRLLSESLSKSGDSSSIVDVTKITQLGTTTSTSTLLRIQLNDLIEVFNPSRHHFAECTIEFSTLEKLLDIVFKDWYRTVSGDYSEPDFDKLKVLLLTRKFSIDDLEITIVNRKMTATYFINDVSHSEGVYIPYEIF